MFSRYLSNLTNWNSFVQFIILLLLMYICMGMGCKKQTIFSIYFVVAAVPHFCIFVHGIIRYFKVFFRRIGRWNLFCSILYFCCNFFQLSSQWLRILAQNQYYFCRANSKGSFTFVLNCRNEAIFKLLLNAIHQYFQSTLQFVCYDYNMYKYSFFWWIIISLLNCL